MMLSSTTTYSMVASILTIWYVLTRFSLTSTSGSVVSVTAVVVATLVCHST